MAWIKKKHIGIKIEILIACPPHVTFQTILFMSTCYALLGFLERIPTGSALKGFETRCEQLAVEGFAFSQVGSLVRQCFGIDVKRRTRNRR